ncbi:MAG TPA: hypothetical protein DCR04_04905 [Flavobacteriales bacterium]|nr:hypothetical protein [Flavobacteriales bacterium]
MKNFRSRSLAALLVFCGIMVGLSGCYKDTFDFDRMRDDVITWEPDIAFPIVYSVLDAEEIISSSDSTNIYQYDSDNFITLIYRRRVFSQTVNDFFQLPQNQTLNSNMNLDGAEISQFTSSGTVQSTLNTGMTLSLTGPGGSQLDKIVFQNGSMNIAFTSNFEHSGNLFVTIPELRLNGNPFSQTYAINYTSGAVNVDIDIPLAGYEMDLDNGSGPNTFPINYTLTLNQGVGVTPTTANQVQISHTFNDLRMAFADGYFGNFNLEINPGEVQLDIAQNNPGTIYFEDPRFKLKVKNTIGAEMSVSIDELYAAGDPGQLDVDISQLLPSGQFIIPGAPAVGDSSYLEYYFTQNNSNIKPIVNTGYDKIYYDVAASVNPSGPAYNFASLNNSVEVIAEVELPFEGYSDHFTIIDTVEVPFDEAESFADNIEKGLLRVNSVSHFPVDGLLKLYFADENYVLTDSVLTNGEFIIRSGTVNADGKTISATQTNNDIELDRQRIDALFASRYLFIAADITTTDDADRNIKLYAEDTIEIRIGLRVKLKADLTVIDEF